MKTTAYIRLDGLRFYAFHGVMPQESRVGSYFTVDLRMEVANSERACTEDALDATVNYAEVFALVKQEMAIPAQLLEHVAWRIVNTLFKAFPPLLGIDIAVAKEHPPFEAECRQAVVELHCKR